MSWRIKEAEHLRMEFVLIAREPEVSMSEACRQFGISRKTGYKWLRRYEEKGLSGLGERSRRPISSPMAASAEAIIEIVRLRQAHEYWGPKKIRALLIKEVGEKGEGKPSVATVARVLKRCNLSEAKGRGRPRRWEPEGELAEVKGPNGVWTVDFKGWWRTGDGERCEPLTIRDLYSRYILCLRPMRKHRTEEVQEVFEEMFERYGMPEVIRSDNGSPFASMTGPQGLTRLSAWWVGLGIMPERIKPGHPEQNGSHERMHFDVSREVEGKPSRTVREEGKRLEEWRVEYNMQRPHEALGMKTPGEVYRRSRKEMREVKEYEYPLAYLVRQVRKDGTVRFVGAFISISVALAGQAVGLERIGKETWRVWFCNLLLGEIDAALGTPLRPTASAPSPTPTTKENQVLPMS
jgi:putative transposase